jgi:tripartite-type tricarboxylate transporter receptor subunit TctC
VAELGFPGYDFQLWIGAVMLRAAPREAVTRLNSEIVRALDTREVRDALDKLGFTPAPLNPEQFDAFLRAEIHLNQKIAQQANIRIE